MNASAITRLLVALWFALLMLWAARWLEAAIRLQGDLVLFLCASWLAMGLTIALARAAAAARRGVYRAILATFEVEGPSYCVLECGGPRDRRVVSCGVLVVTDGQIRYLHAPVVRNALGGWPDRSTSPRELKLDRRAVGSTWTCTSDVNFGIATSTWIRIDGRFFAVDTGTYANASAAAENRRLERQLLAESGRGSRERLVVGEEIGFLGAKWFPLLLLALALQSTISDLILSSPHSWLGGHETLIAQIGLTVVGVAAVVPFMKRRSARVEITDEELVFYRDRRVRVPWVSVASYRDDSADYIQLVATDETASAELAIPTPDEHERAMVLALLDARGIYRDEPAAVLGG